MHPELVAHRILLERLWKQLGVSIAIDQGVVVGGFGQVAPIPRSRELPSLRRYQRKTVLYRGTVRKFERRPPVMSPRSRARAFRPRARRRVAARNKSPGSSSDSDSELAHVALRWRLEGAIHCWAHEQRRLARQRVAA
jgi:hypothetical protein